MSEQYWSLLGGVAPVFLIIVAGFTIRRLGWLTAEADHSLLRLTINLLYPCLIFDSILGNKALNEVGNVVLAPSLGLATILLGLGLCLLLSRILPLDDRQARTFAFAAGIQNYGFIPVPLIQKFFSKETTGVLFAYNLGVEIAFWTAGIYILTPPSSRSSGWKQIFNAPVIAIIISLILNFCRASGWLPSFVSTTAHMLGQSSVPLSLILTGATLADWLSQNNPRAPGIAALGGCVTRLLILPALFLLITKCIPASPELKRVLVVQASMPAAMLPIVIAKRYGGDPDIAMQVVLSSTLVGLLMIPLWIQLGLWFVGV